MLDIGLFGPTCKWEIVATANITLLIALAQIILQLTSFIQKSYTSVPIA